MISQRVCKVKILIGRLPCMLFLTSTARKTTIQFGGRTTRYLYYSFIRADWYTWVQGSVWDKELIKKFYTLLKNHQGSFVVLDLGAQTGSFSLLAKYFPQSSWYAFEPIEEAVNTLKDNLLLNNIQNVAVHQVAVTDFSGFITLAMPPMDSWGLATVGSNPLRFTSCHGA